MFPNIALDKVREHIRTAVLAGQTEQLFAQLAKRYGIVFDSRLGKVGFLAASPQEIDESARWDGVHIAACDAQPELVTQPNAAIPAWLTNYFDPAPYTILTSPLKAAEIIGQEVKKGDWTTDTATFITVEHTGETSSYGDYSNNGSSTANINFPQRQSYAYQIFTQWGEKQMARAGEARVNWANEVTAAALSSMAQFQNNSYFYGISGLQNYGLFNDPSLYPAIVAAAPWNASTTTPEQIYEDIRRLFTQLQLQGNGTVSADAAMTLGLSPSADSMLDKTNSFGLSTRNQLAKHFPNLTIKTAVQYDQQTGGRFAQLICPMVEGRRALQCAFTEKMRSHALVVGHSSWSQKRSAGTFGTIIFNSTAIAQLSGI